MEEGGKILKASLAEDEYGDTEMLDAEEGELVDPDIVNDPGQSNVHDSEGLKQEKESKNRRQRANKTKNKKKRSGPEPNVTDINRFVLDTCRRLREKKSYMVYTAVCCLGVFALSDLVREACGGQMTADGKRQKTGGGILWGIIKVREPNAYREIMKRAKEFERQFKPQNAVRAAVQGNKASPNPTSEGNPAGFPEASDGSPRVENRTGHPHADETPKPIKDRMRVPISYEDIIDDAEGTT
ncbi:uncharacterized protein LOC116196724 isoform X2 [Punica granatum]|uniref:Phosphorylated adapter RNA export protein n=1 Tax=Punica granatum TaxID=22663 RepID=A0A6P8CEM1_PUNGR|nr:uncharacterized protein LOC116196724 isoform X2 [Punica granatum]